MLGITDFTGCSSCYCVLCAMGIKIFLSGHMPGASKLPICIHNTKNMVVWWQLVAVKMKLLNCLILQKSLHMIYLTVKTLSFLLIEKDVINKEKEVHESK